MQRFGHPVSGCVHPDAAAEEDADRRRTMSIDDLAQSTTEIVQTTLPRCRLQHLTAPQQRTFQPLRMVVHFWKRSSLWAKIAARDRMIAITSYAYDPFTLRVDHDAAQRCANAAEASLGSGFGHIADPFGSRVTPAV